VDAVATVATGNEEGDEMRRRSTLTTFIAVAVAAAVTSATASAAGPTWEQALKERSEGLNRKYSLDDTTPAWQRALDIRSEGMNSHYGVGGVTPDWQQALAARSEALNVQYGLGDVSSRPDEGTRGPAPTADPAPVTPTVRTVDSGFDWTAAGVGAVSSFALVLILAAATIGLRGRQRMSPA
jgi:hypothetical protein